MSDLASPALSSDVTSNASPAGNKGKPSSTVWAGRVAEDLSLPTGGVAAVLALLDEGATVPFIARYRKERTGSLDEVQIRDVAERAQYLSELEERRAFVLSSIEEQGKLSEGLNKRILAAVTKTELEDLYLPYKKKRRTKATIAKERGLEPLADLIAAQPTEGTPEEAAQRFVDASKEVPDVQTALAGATDILVERLADDADSRAKVRALVAERGELASELAPEHKAAKEQGKKTKFDDFDGFSEPIEKMPSHRFLAVRRGQTEGVLRTKLDADLDDVVPLLEERGGIDRASAFAPLVQRAASHALIRLRIHAETDVMVEAKRKADIEAVGVFADNLKDLLLAAPLGAKSVVGIDPGIRTGCKIAVVDDTGRFLETTTVYLSQGAAKRADADATLLALVHRFRPTAIAVGNGTYGRETEAWLRPLVAQLPEETPRPFVVSVNEAGASVYSASDVARDEFPDLDLTVRGAISIARRLQDPLAELVKIDPKSIGVGQYQHDVLQTLLQKKLDEVVEDCVNKVGVELNTASGPLLSRVAGIGPSLAKRIVQHRESHGAFPGRKELLKVSGLGPKAFEQCAGFLRVHKSAHPLDNSAVHPERYGLVEKMAADAGVELSDLVGSAPNVKKIDLKRYVTDEVGEPTLKDILDELQRPGRDPRQTFEPPKFRDDVNTMEDLKVGMKLDGVVTNVTAFGAFVDVGVHQDGLVHISKLADRYVSDPREVVRSGQPLKVTVLEVDLERKRISLSARSDEHKGGSRNGGPGGRKGPGGQGRGPGGSGGGGRGNGQRSGNPNGAKGAPVGQPGKQEDLKHNPFAALLKR